MTERTWATRTERKRCRAYYKANAESIKAKRRARYRAKVLGKGATPVCGPTT